MIIVCKQGATADQLESLRKRMVELGLNFEEMPGDYQTVFGVRGDVSKVNKGQIEVMDAVQEVKLISLPYKTIARQVEGHTKDRNTVQIEGINMGGPKVVMASRRLGLIFSEVALLSRGLHLGTGKVRVWTVWNF